jgi:hypothetical protein
MSDQIGNHLFLGRITPGMDVCDVTGEKVGSISHIYRIDDGTATPPDAATSPDAATPVRSADEFFEVKTGFLGLGKHYYIPLSAVQEVLTDSIFLSKSRESFEELGYENRPSHLAQVS